MTNMFLTAWETQVQLKSVLMKQLKIPQKGVRRQSASERKLSEITHAPFPAYATLAGASKDPFIIGYQKLNLQNC